MIRIIAADSGCAELDDRLRVKNIICTSAVYLEHPYKHPTAYLCNTVPFSYDSPEYIIREMELAKELAIKYKPDQIHLDVSLGAVEIKDLSKEYLENTKISRKGREQLIEVIDSIKKIGEEIKNIIDCEILFIGKDSWAVRIAELNTASCAMKYAIEKLVSNDINRILIGCLEEALYRLHKNLLLLDPFIPMKEIYSVI